MQICKEILNRCDPNQLKYCRKPHLLYLLYLPLIEKTYTALPRPLANSKIVEDQEKLKAERAISIEIDRLLVSSKALEENRSKFEKWLKMYRDIESHYKMQNDGLRKDIQSLEMHIKEFESMPPFDLDKYNLPNERQNLYLMMT
jgi:hypothetical protein